MGENMSHTLKFSIEVEVTIPDNEYGLELQNRFVKKLIADIPERISFEELEKMLCLSGLQYYMKSVEYAKRGHFPEDSITKFVITG
jgi:hypothetical protein